MFVFHHFLPQKQAFMSSEVLEGHKRDKKLSPTSVWGTNGGQNLFFIKFPVEICNIAKYRYSMYYNYFGAIFEGMT